MQRDTEGAIEEDDDDGEESGVDEVHAPQPIGQHIQHAEEGPDRDGHARSKRNERSVERRKRPRPIRAWRDGEYENQVRGGIPLQASRTRSSEYGVDEVNAPEPLPARREESYLEQELTHEEEERDLSEVGTTANDKKTSRELIEIHWHRFVVVSWLVFFSVWGALGRIGLVWLEGYRGAPVFGLIWAQFIGCSVIGFLAEDAVLFSAIGKAAPFYVGIGTGFAGSMTSFSSFTLDAFDGMVDSLPGRSKGYNVLALLAQVIVTLSMSVSGLRLGAQVNSACKPLSQFKAIPAKSIQTLDLLGIILGWGCLVAAIIITSVLTAPTWRLIGFTAIFAPLGTLLRYVLARLLNTRIPKFPLGTFAANIFGSLLLAVWVVVITVASPTGVPYAILYGLQNGFCGCLTTVSTFTLELVTLHRKAAWVYGGVSIITGYCLFVLILGSYTWSSG